MTHHSTGVFLSHDDLQKLPPAVSSALIKVVFGPREAANPVEARPNNAFDVPDSSQRNDEEDADDEHFAELSPGQAREFIKGCGDKTKAAVEAIAKSETRFFQVADVATALGLEAPMLRSVWGGLTRRTKTITKDDEAYLIYWPGEAVLDAQDQYIDERGEISEMTYRSFRKALGIA